MRKKEIFVWLLLLGPMVLLGGCVIAAVGAGAGTVAYVRGDLEAAEPKELGDVYKATVKAVEELELNVIEKNKDAMTATFIMRDAEDKKIRIISLPVYLSRINTNTNRDAKCEFQVFSFWFTVF